MHGPSRGFDVRIGYQANSHRIPEHHARHPLAYPDLPGLSPYAASQSRHASNGADFLRRRPPGAMRGRADPGHRASVAACIREPRSPECLVPWPPRGHPLPDTDARQELRGRHQRRQPATNLSILFPEAVQSIGSTERE